MPQFEWESGGIGYPWSLDDEFSSEELYYRMLYWMPKRFLDPPYVVNLRMYSALETRWLTIATYEISQLEWPWIDVDMLDLERRLRYIEVRDHARGWRQQRFQNPCGEIRLSGEHQMCNIKIPKRDRWKEVFTGTKVPRIGTPIHRYPARSERGVLYNTRIHDEYQLDLNSRSAPGS